KGDGYLVVEAEDVGFAEMEEGRVITGLDSIRDRLATREAEHDTAADQQHRQGGDEGRHSQYRNQHPVEETDYRTQRKTEENRRKWAKIGEARRKEHREGDADQPVGRTDREIEILVDDDEGHAHRHHRVARGIAQHGVKRFTAAEEGRIDQSAAG